MKMTFATALVVPAEGSPFKPTEVRLEPLQPGEVLVDLVATSVCHTDIKVQYGHIPVSYPAVLGHEGSGVVREVGSDVEGLVPGDHVVLSYNYCGDCHSCRSRKTYQCDQIETRNFGCKRPDGSSTIKSNGTTTSTCFFGQSSFCNPAIVQKASCVKVDKGLPLQAMCAMGCGFQTGAGSVYHVVKPLERSIRHLAIFGIGGVGCAALMAAKHLASNDSRHTFSIIAIDINNDRLPLAKELGATHVNNSQETSNIRETIDALTGDNGVDAAIDCTGSAGVIEQMMGLIAAGGIAVSVGGPPRGTKINIDVFEMLIQCKTYSGCHQGNSYSREFIPWLTNVYLDGHFPLHKMQKTYPAREINTACEDMLSGKVVKPILLWKNQDFIY